MAEEERHDSDGEDASAKGDRNAQAPHHSDTKSAGDASDQEGKDEADKSGDGGDQKDDGADQGPPLYKRPLFWIIAGIVALVLVVGGLLYWLHARRYVSSDDAFVDTHIVRITAQIAGQLTVIPNLDNREVGKGQLLAVIDPSQPQAQLQEAQASVTQADAAIEQAQARVVSAIATQRQQAANAVGLAAQALRAAHDYQRYAALERLDPAAAAATQIEQARTDATNTAAQAAAARRQTDAAAADAEAARKDVKSNRAQRQVYLARVDQARVTNSFLRIAAPVNGQVVNRQVNVGSYVAIGQQLMALVPEKLWVTANFKETQLERMRPGQHVDIRIDAYPGIVFAGHVDSIQRGAGQTFALLPPQNATGNYVKVVQRVPVRILFDGAEWRHYAIGPGMSVIPRVTVR